MPRRVFNIGRNFETMRTRRSSETPAEYRERIRSVSLQISQLQAKESDSQHELRNQLYPFAILSTSNTNRLIFKNLAFRYDHIIDYSLSPIVAISGMNNICVHFKALKFKNEAQGLCCANGNVILPVLNDPPEPLLTLISGTTPQSYGPIKFLEFIEKYQNCRALTV